MTEETENTETETEEAVASDSQPAAPAETEEPTVEGESSAPAADGADTEGATGATPEPSGPKKKRKHLPRAERPKKGRRTRTPAAERKAIVRLPKPEHERGRTQERRGVVVSSAMDKTIVVKVDVIKSHPRYKKVVRRSVKFHAHDEQNAANVGDVVRIVETRPLSATKRWRLAEIVEAAK
jgi:small subunit ribosomal protein S17